MSLQIRRGTEVQRAAMSVPLDNGELVWTDEKKLFIGDGTTNGGVHVMAGSLGAGLTYNSLTKTISFNQASLSLATQLVPEGYTTTYTATGSSGTTLKVGSSIGLQIGMVISGTGFTTQTVTNVSGDGVTLTISAIPGTSPAPTDGQSLTFTSTNQYFTSARSLAALNTALAAGTQTGISFNYNAGAGTLSVQANVVPSYAGTGAYPGYKPAGTIIFNSSDNHFYGYNGTIWKQLDN
jgi:hypothetical protein